MLPQLRQHLVEVKPQLRQALLRHLDEDFFLLHTEQFDFGDVPYAQQLLAHAVGKYFQFGISETVGLQCINNPIHITEVIVEKRTLHARRQRSAHVTELFAHGVPTVGDISALDGVLDLKNDL